MYINKTEFYGGIEAGGTKFVCAAGSGPEDIQEITRFPTTTPEETLGRAIDFFRQQMNKGRLKAVGIASFGPLDLNSQSPTFGYITTAPKAGWNNVSIAGVIRGALGVPVTLDTDVNLAGLAEARWGAVKDLENFVYLTIGTGIGGGGMMNGRLMHGLVHPEMGHIRIPHDFKADPFPGSCPFHGDCLEGLASGKAMEKRWGTRPENIPPDHQAWELEAGYLAAGVANFVCTLSPQRIVLGGGVMKTPGLLPAVRHKMTAVLNSYFTAPQLNAGIEEYLVPPALGDLSGVLGAIALAQENQISKL
jgi:fructokinase